MTATIIPTMRYHDASRAVAWLCEAFGFERQSVQEGDNGVVEHAQLTLGTGMVMLGNVRDNEHGTYVTTVREVGKPTMSPYIIIDDVPGHAEHARSAGAKIAMEPTTQDYGGESYSCLDFEGNLWNFGTYDPWE